MRGKAAFCRALAALVLVLGLGVASADASSISFNFTGSNSDGSIGNQRVYTDGTTGLKVYVTAFFHDGTDLNPAAVGRYGSGLGGCNPNEDGSSFPCDSPNHAVDNNREKDFLLFLFSAPVDLTSMSVVEISGNTDVSYWVGNYVGGAATQFNYLTNILWTGLPALGFGARQDNNGDGSRTVTLNSPANSYTALLFGASALPKSSGTQVCLWIFCDGGKDDYFKVSGLTVDFTSPPERSVTETPEPATFVLLGMGLVGVAAARRRRLAAKP